MGSNAALRELGVHNATDEESKLQLENAATDVGNQLFEQREPALRTFMRTLSDVQDQQWRTDDPYVVGFRDAVLGVMYGFLEMVRDAREEAEVVELARKGGWRPVLAAIVDTDASRPGEIAAATGMDPAQVSRALAEMREAGVVVYQPVEGADRRARPHIFTGLGLRVAEKLGPGVPPQYEKAFELAAAVFARLANDRRVTERTCAELARQIISDPQIDAPGAAKRLLETAAKRGLVVEQEGAHLGADLTAQGTVYRLLIDAVDKARTPAFLDAVAAKAAADTRLVVRSARPHDLWSIFFKRVDNPFGSRAMVVDGADLLVDAIEPPGEPYTLLYESATLLKDDHAAGVAAMRKLEQKAARRLCLTPREPAPLERGYEAIPVAAA